jgi:inorganic pyrophosphatase
MSQRNLLELPAFERITTNLNVVVQSPRGSASKLKDNPATDAFELSYILPAGSTFPFEFGFIPSTLGEDGDPLDMLILMDVPTCVGCILIARAIGVIEAEQTEKGNTFRNDRLIGVALASHQRAALNTLAKLEASTIKETSIFLSLTTRCASVNSGRFGGRAWTRRLN